MLTGNWCFSGISHQAPLPNVLDNDRNIQYHRYQNQNRYQNAERKSKTAFDNSVLIGSRILTCQSETWEYSSSWKVGSSLDKDTVRKIVLRNSENTDTNR